ncbi:MAG: XdhC family protein [Candidatus Coatesbacteria bacterium]|nr:XdhC family protein [Candidatus Coatesbacteria bacterium]
MLDKALEWKKSNIPFMLVSITEIKGETPREPGTSMIININGEQEGTIGGGTLELLAREASMEFLAKNTSGKKKFDLGFGKGTGTDMICGGYVECFFLYFGSSPILVIVGGGHVGQAVHRQADILGYSVIIIDDRDITENNLAVKPLKHIKENWQDFLMNDPIIDESYVVIATRGHKLDEEALKIILKRNPLYIGMIGSNKKVTDTKKNLMNIGYKEEEMEKIFAPIGLDLGGGSPEEIALSILAEIQVVRNRKTGKHLKIK